MTATDFLMSVSAQILHSPHASCGAQESANLLDFACAGAQRGALATKESIASLNAHKSARSSGILCLGAVMLDLACPVDNLPQAGQGIIANSAQATIGGCAFNTAHAAQLAGAQVRLLAPIGQGCYANFLQQLLSAYSLAGIPVEGGPDNGVVICLILPDGERTMITLPGIERTQDASWLRSVKTEGYGYIELCGYEVDAQSGDALIDFLEAHPELECWFAPGPPIMRIAPVRIQRLMRLHANWHLNAEEARAFTQCASLEEAGAALVALTQAAVVITDGACGSHVFVGEEHLMVPACPVKVVDTTGAGDSHLGALLAARAQGAPWEEALKTANNMGAAACQIVGALLPDGCLV